MAAKAAGPKHYVTRALTALAGFGLLGGAWTAIVLREPKTPDPEAPVVAVATPPTEPAPATEQAAASTAAATPEATAAPVPVQPAPPAAQLPRARTSRAS